MGIPIFLIFAPKIIAGVVLTCTHYLCFEQKYEKFQNLAKKITF